jgi:hypothetical protein
MGGCRSVIAVKSGLVKRSEREVRTKVQGVYFVMVVLHARTKGFGGFTLLPCSRHR